MAQFILLRPTSRAGGQSPDMLSKATMRVALFIAVSSYAWLMVCLLEAWRNRRHSDADREEEKVSC